MAKTTQETGGTAFPITENVCAGEHAGLTKRDYFAAMALPAIIDKASVLNVNGNWRTDTTPQRIAEMAYELADAMLIARLK